MSRRWFWIGATFSFLTLSALGADRDAQWTRVEAAIQKGLPRTAIEELEPIIRGALQDKAYGEAVKALGRKLVLEGDIQGNKPEEKILRLQAEVTKAPKEIGPLLETILAHWYWHYFQNNRWRFVRRTATAQAPGTDFTTWDLPRLFREIDTHFQKALSNPDILKRTAVSDFDALLEKGTMPDKYRPSLYDFLAQEALSFYTVGEQAGARPQEAFQINADSPIFAGTDQFLTWKPATTETNALQLRAIRLYQELLRFHQNDDDPSAYYDADMGRLVYGNNVAFGENKEVLYTEALRTLLAKAGNHEFSTFVTHQLARAIQAKGDWVEARRLASEAVTRFPESLGAKLCVNLIADIDARALNVTTERVWNTPSPKIQTRYRNLTNLYFRAVPHDWSAFLDRRRNRPESLNDEERKELLSRRASLEWSAKLPPTTNYQERTEMLPAPQNLKPGFYFLLASAKPDFSEEDNQISFTDFWVSELALILRPRAGKIEGFVLEANSGEPLAGAEVTAWHLDREGNRIENPKVQTDQNGLFAFGSEQNRAYLFRVRHRDRELSSQTEHAAYQHQDPQERTQTIFFTDRALYRPGQIIQYKGICLVSDQQSDTYQTLTGQEVTLVFLDPNGKEIARQRQRANDYGSFSGSFTAPNDRVMGRMTIRVDGGPNGATSFAVEEYKRPKFEVTLDAPQIAAKVNDKVSLSGHATAYTGAAIDNAAVKYRVVRVVQWPYWWHWYGWRSRGAGGEQQEIANGFAKTEADGSFKIEFVAKPDPSAAEEDEPVFAYQIHTDVTDNAGETRSAERTIQVGYVALRATLSIAEWQPAEKPVEVTLRTETLDGENQQAEGRLRIYRLKEPERVHRAELLHPYHDRGEDRRPDPDLSNPNNWEPGEVALERGLTTDAEGRASVSVKLPVGVYRAIFESQDRFGKTVTGRSPIQVIDPAATKLAIKVPHLLTAPPDTMEPGKEYLAVWGTGYETGRALIEIEHRHEMIQRYWTPQGQTQAAIRQAIDESMRGGFTLHVTQVRENRAYLASRHVDVPWSNKDLEIKWEHFTSKLEPSQKETWTAVITGPNAQKAVAEMAATLYDASLDTFMRHHWQNRFSVFRRDYSTANAHFENAAKYLQWLRGTWASRHVSAEVRYREFPEDLVQNFRQYEWRSARGRSERYRFARGAVTYDLAGAAPSAPGMAMEGDVYLGTKATLADSLDWFAGRAGEPASTSGTPVTKGPDLTQVTARKNLNETAFFFPHLISSSNGAVKLQFTMPESLTQWRFLAFAHDRDLRSALLEGETVTAKDIMVQPNAPRFVREGDVIEFTVKVSNQSAARQAGTIRLTFGLARTGDTADKALGNTSNDLPFDVPAKESRSHSWKIKVPDGIGFLTYKTVASTGKLSDGEEGFLPVLSRRIFVTESLPLPIRGAGTKKFNFAKLAKSGRSDTLDHYNLTVQMVSNPSWYAVMALPYLMEFPYECSEQIFNRLYANSLARHIANSDPRIRNIFDQWKNTPALDSPLEKNQELKSVLLEETPWLRQAQSESQSRRNVGILFDENRLDSEMQRNLQKLMEQQLQDGSWPWFPGGRGNDYITLYITTGFGRMRHLGLTVDTAAAVRALTRLDTWIDGIYRDILRNNAKDANHLTPTIALYLYGRSFFLKDKPISANHKEAVQYFQSQAKQYWLDLANRQSQAHLAIALHRFGEREAARGIMKSIKERSVTNEEMGMFWRDTELSWWWYRAPIETQAMMVEAFDEVMQDAAAVEDCKVWLLKQKQTQDWRTTKATADAVYALLLRGSDLLASDALVEVTVGGQDLKPAKVEAGTGFYEQKFAAAEVKPRMGEIRVKKVDAGVSWGSVHWQYFEDISKVTPHQGTPLKLKKTVYTKENTSRGPVIELVKGPLKVGDELVVRIELRTDRDMEYVHLKDQRGSGTEPLNVLSQYRFQDGLAYYESTRDTASHFFIDYLPKGVYVFEYSTRIFHKGQYPTGIAEIQCMYAPEFNSHSESHRLVVN